MSHIPPASPNNPPVSRQTDRNQEPTGKKDQKPFQKEKKKEQDPAVGGQVEGDIKQMGKGKGSEALQPSFKTEGVQQKLQLANAHAAILRGVEAMRVAGDGKTVEIDLKKTPNLPPSLQGGTMSLKTDGPQTIIRFDNIDVASAQLLLGNQAAKEQLAQVLAAKDIHQAQIQLGDTVSFVVGRQAPAIPSPIEAQFGAQQDYTQQQGGGGRGGGGGGGGQGKGEKGPRE